MIKVRCDILFQDPMFKKRALRHASVTELDNEGFVVEFDDDPVPLEVDDEVIVYFDDDGNFMQQVVRIREIVRQEPRLQVVLTSIGDATCAESRKHFRVSTLSSEIHARIGEEADCAVQEVSATGFSVVAGESYDLGSTIEVAIEYEGDFFCGSASIQSILELRPGHLRYGLKALDTGLEGSELLDGLQQISQKIEHHQNKSSG